MAKEKLYKYKTIRNKGAYHHLISMSGQETWRHHNWDGPAIEPIEGEESEFKKSWYLHGIQYDQESYKEALSNREGLPWYKQVGANVRH